MSEEARILIIDDDVALLQALPQALHLRMAGVEVDTSDTALEALEQIRVIDYNAIVSDIKMPGMDGLVLLANVREIRPHTPVLLITGHGDHNLAIQALRGGAYDFIQKPIDRDYFVAALGRAIQTHQLRSRVAEQQRALEQHARALEVTVQERTRELMAANTAKDEFLSMASHELKTPLSSLKGMTQLLRRKLARAGSPEVVNLIGMENAIRRMEVLVNDLLSISFIETGMFHLRCQRYEIGELCRRLIGEYKAGVTPEPVVVLDAPDESVEVNVDADRIGQVIINLLSNARKYSSADAPITMTICKMDGMCSISVHDKGVGLPSEELLHIFDRFYRVPGVEVRTGSSVGLGLGLYIARHIVEQHGGRIEVESTPGRGSTFSVILPLFSEQKTATESLSNENSTIELTE